MSRRSTLVALVTVSTALVAPPVEAAAAPPPVPGAEVSPVMDPQRAIDYWTARKQSRADAVDLPENVVIPRSAGSRVSVPRNERLTPGSDVNGYARVRKPYRRTLEGRATGRLFFLDAAGDRRSCSGAVVRSARKLLVATASHCVYGVAGRGGRATWSEHIAFVPAYDGKAASLRERAPYGVWGARRVYKPRSFTGVSPYDWDSIYDLALVEVGRRGGATLQGTVGGFTPLRNEGGRHTVASLGYPSDAPYDGTRQLWCLARTRPWAGHAVRGETGGRLRTDNCHLYGGNSGGPWLTRDDGLLIGVLTSGANDEAGHGYAVANPLGRDSFGAVVRRADPAGVYDALSVEGSGTAREVTATVTMRGLMAAAQVPVTFTLPPGSRAGDAPGCEGEGRRVTCTLALIRPGESVRVSVPVRIPRDDRPTATVSVGSTFLDPDPRDNRDTFQLASR
ncbi:trypsin-like peptidase domain-containing protein [Nonomuraea sp. NPDC050478]|uniref:trypsin-like peptidase domain-containing protein n=1 Tax=Nonomuraea sp. NPDC050478 TaxID=3364365 RepID=UPI0037A6CB61